MEAEMTRTPSPEEVMAAKQPNGYWPAEKLIEWGVGYPPPVRWRERLERRWHEENIPGEVRDVLLRAGYDDQGVETAWRSEHFGLGRMRMFEEYWKDPAAVMRALRGWVSEVVLEHPDGGQLVLRMSLNSKLADRTIKTLGKLGWEQR